jgi:hypothetical protein
MSDTTKPVSPEDVIPDGAEGGDFNGTYVRKGTVAAFIANVRVLNDLQRGGAEYEAVADHIRSMKPALEAAGLFDVFEIRDPTVAEILDR